MSNLIIKIIKTVFKLIKSDENICLFIEILPASKVKKRFIVQQILKLRLTRCFSGYYNLHSKLKFKLSNEDTSHLF